jgi:hypothetical protein
MGGGQSNPDLHFKLLRNMGGPQDKSWSTIMNIGNGDNENRFLIIAFLEDGGIGLVEYFKKMRKIGVVGNVGFDRLNESFHILAELKIVLKKPQN